MSTCWFYRFRAALRPDLRDLDVETIMARAPVRFGQVRFPLEPVIHDDRAAWPVMGPDTSYDGARFAGLVGASVVDGELRLGIWAQNLERAPGEDADGLTHGAEGTRLDLLTGFLSWATVGTAGEVVGCIAHQDTERGHAHPLVRCDDGLIRMVWTDHAHEDDWPGSVSDDEETVEIPARLPCDLIEVEGPSRAAIDSVALRERYRAIDGELASASLAGPRGR